MADTNPFELLEREKSSPAVGELETLATPIAGRTSEASPTLELHGNKLETVIPVTHQESHAPATPGRDKSDIKIDLDQAPGTVSYAEAAKEHKDAAGEKARESAAEAKESLKDAGQAAKEGAKAAEAKAGQAVEATKESFSEAAQATKEKASEVAQSTKETASDVAATTQEKASEVAQAAKEKTAQAREVAGEYAEAARERGAEVVDAAKEYAHIAAEKTQEAASAAGETVRSVVDTVKEHLPSLPRVERAETSPADRESKALLDEALALATGSAFPTHTERRPELYAAPATTTPASSPATPTPVTTTTPGLTTSTPTTTTSSSSYVDRGEGPYEAARGMVPDTLALDPSIASGSDAPSDLLARGEKKAEALLGEAREAVGEAVPANPLAAVVDKVKGVAEYVREHLTHPGRNYGEAQQAQQQAQQPAQQQARPGLAVARQPHPQPLSASPPASPRVHEYRALPGDVHIPLLAKAVRESLLPSKEPAASAQEAVDAAKSTGERLAGEAKSALHSAEDKVSDALGTNTSETRSSMRSAEAKTESALHSAQAKTQHALGTVEDKTASTYEAAKDKASAAADNASGLLQSAEDKAAGLYHSAADSVSGAYHAAADKVQQVEDKAKWAVDHTKEKLHESAEQWRDSVTPHTVEEAKLAQGEVPSNTEDILRARANPLTPTTTAVAPDTQPGHSSIGDAVREGAKEVMGELDHANPGGAGELPS
ncbi:hypothetical protein N2152v2_008448 [Parachlorella kessleri]